MKLIPQYVEQTVMRLHFQAMKFAVDCKRHWNLHAAPPLRAIAVRKHRRLITPSMARRYSLLPLTSVRGEDWDMNSDKIASLSSSAACGEASSPVESIARSGVDPTAPYAIRVSPESVTQQLKLTVARSTPHRRAMRPKAEPVGSTGMGRSIERTTSPCSSTVRPGPTKNSLSGTFRCIDDDPMFTIAP